MEITTSSRPLANYHPNIWGDSFLIYTPESPTGGEQELVEKLKEEVKTELIEASNDDVRLLKLVDAIQRLGIEYHFEEEIDHAFKNLSKKFEDSFKDNNDIYTVALGFRLLRQHGYRISCNIFDKFKDGEGGFTGEVVGVLELFEATHLRVHDEDILDEANIFSRKFLEQVLPSLSDPEADLVHHALHGYSNRRGLPRVEARHYISVYPQLPSHHQTLLELAKLDFNLLQALHKTEMSELYRWWTDMDVPRNLAYARDRMVEAYFWILGVYFEPKYGFARNILCKLLAIASLFDDTYDAYATYQELQLFTQAVERWSYSCLEILPDYMKIFYKAMLAAFEEFEEDIIKQGTSNHLSYAMEAMKVIARDYFVEIKWRDEKYKPKSEEYMQVATASCAYTSLIIISFVGMGDIVRKEHFEFVLSRPHVVKAALNICRLTDDVVGHEFEQERRHIPSWVECYTEEKKISKAEAVLESKNRIEASWKDINEAFLKPTSIPTPLLYRILNFSRVIEVMYSKGDWYTHVGPQMQKFISQLLIHPIP